MVRLIAVTSLLLSFFVAVVPGRIVLADGRSLPPSWQVRGFVAALSDKYHDNAIFALRRSGHATAMFRALSNESSELRNYASRAAALLNDLLKHKNEKVRVAAAQGLGTLGTHAAKYEQQLVGLLEDKSPRVRVAAAQALGALGTRGAKYEQQLVGLLEDKSSRVRVAAAQALGALGTDAAKYAPQLVAQLKDRNWRVRAAAAQGLGALGTRGAKYEQQLVGLLEDKSSRVRAAAAQALGALGTDAAKYAPQLVAQLKDRNWRVRAAAAQGLGALGTRGAKYWPQLVTLLKDRSGNIRVVAVQALGALGSHAAKYAPQLAALLKDKSWRVRAAAARGLGALGTPGAKYGPQLVTLLKDRNWRVRAAAARALGTLAMHDANYAPQIILLLNDKDEYSYARVAAAEALGAMGTHAAVYAPQLAALLKDKSWRVRAAAAKALGALGAHGAKYAPQIAVLLNDKDANDYARATMAQALGTVGRHTMKYAAQSQYEYASQLAGLLTDNADEVRAAAAGSLGTLGHQAAARYTPQIAGLLADEDDSVRIAAERALITLGPLEPKFLPTILTHRYQDTSLTAKIRSLAYMSVGDNTEAQILLSWVGGSNQPPIKKIKNNNSNLAKKTLLIFKQAWTESRNFSIFRADLADQIGKIVTLVNWDKTDRDLLKWFETSLNDAGFVSQANSAGQKIRDLDFLEWKWGTAFAVLFHTVFWFGLIVVYPQSRQVQALFFWNKWIRLVAGLGYIGFLLTWVPFLRRRLFFPFKDTLIADALVDELEENSYYKGSLVIQKNGGSRPAIEVFCVIRGPTILEGESGLGKTMLVRYIVKNYKNLIVFLRASDCNVGVLEAIRGKLEGLAQDPSYLRKLIYAGAIDIVVDGVNEVSLETRAEIILFARRFSRGNLLLVTQPMDWEPPPLSKNYTMQSLTSTQIEEFLVGRYNTLDEHEIISKKEFAAKCHDFVVGALDSKQPKDKVEAMRRVISNPMDLTIVAQMLSDQKAPDLFSLQEQYFTLMSEDYTDRTVGDLQFPLAEFSEYVYHKRASDELVFSPDESQNEIHHLARHKMMVPYHDRKGKSKVERGWVFRHEKIMDFFLVQAFLGSGNKRPATHLGDYRFRGTYFQLANLLPIEQAEALEKQLIYYAADSKDHSISDDFIQLIRNRKSTEYRLE